MSANGCRKQPNRFLAPAGLHREEGPFGNDERVSCKRRSVMYILRMPRAIRPTIFIATLIALSNPALAETRMCANELVTAHSQDSSLLPAMCAASDRALALFDKCGLAPSGPVEITISELTGQSCLGLFHCGEARIEVLAPSAIDSQRSTIGVFNTLSTPRLFESIIVHEMAHAAMDQTPCPYDNCVATEEYFAYGAQLLDLSEQEREQVLRDETPASRITHDEINAFVLYMAPDIFVEKVWGHVSRSADVCGQLQRVQDGSLIFDRFHP